MLNIKVLINEDKVDSTFHKTCAKKYQIKNTFKTGIKYECLSDQQKNIIQKFQEHIRQPRRLILENPQRVIINAEAGTGKSVVGKFLKKALIDRANRDPVLDFMILGYTGTSATGLGGSTIHSAFRIPSYYEPYSLANLLQKPMHENFKHKLQRVHVIIIDERSLLGLRFLNFIDQIFRKADAENKDIPFASRSVYLIGDFRQLFCIRDYPLHCTDFGNASDDHILMDASQVYHSFNTVYTLSTIFRQIGDENENFRALLSRLRVGASIPADLELLRTRLQANVTEQERERFREILHIFSFRKDVLEHNMKMLHEKCKEIVTIPNGLDGEVLEIGIGARVALTRNINVSFHLVNGIIGNVVDIKYNDRGKVKFVLVDFGPSYIGRAVAKTSRGQGVPIFPMSNQQLVNGRLVCYKAFPLCLRWASTGHATQSLTLDMVAIKLGAFEFFANMDYTLLTRCKNLSSILLLDSELPAYRLDYSLSRHRKAFEMNEKEDKRLELLAKQ